MRTALFLLTYLFQIRRRVEFTLKSKIVLEKVEKTKLGISVRIQAPNPSESQAPLAAANWSRSCCGTQQSRKHRVSSWHVITLAVASAGPTCADIRPQPYPQTSKRHTQILVVFSCDCNIPPTSRGLGFGDAPMSFLHSP